MTVNLKKKNLKNYLFEKRVSFKYCKIVKYAIRTNYLYTLTINVVEESLVKLLILRKMNDFNVNQIKHISKL